MRPTFYPSALMALLIAFSVSSCALQPVKRSYTPDPASSWEPKSENLKRAQSFYSLGEYGNSIATLGLVDESKLSAPGKTEYWNLKGLIRLAEKNYTAAIIDFKKASEVNPNPEFAGYYDYNLASAWYDYGKPEEAKAILSRIDASKMTEIDQRKITNLREKILKNTGGDISKQDSANPGTPAINSGSLASQGLTPALGPVEIYNGKVEDKKIGLLLPLTGKYENFGKKVRRSVELAFQTSTDPVIKSYELIAEDAGDTPESHLEALKKLVEDQHVIAIIGPLLGKSLDAIRVKAEYYQTPLISVAQVQGKLSSSIFSCSISVRDQVTKVVDYAINTKHFKRFAILAPSNKAGEESASAFWDELDKLKGEVRGFELYDPDLTDFREPVDKTLGLHYTETREKEINELAEKRKELNITKKTMKTIQYFNLPPLVDFDAVFIADEAKTVGQIIPTFAYRDAKNMNYIGISSWNSNQLLQRAGDLAEGAIFPVAFNTKNPPAETKRFFDLYSTTYSIHPGELDAVAFDAASVMIQGISKAPATRAEFTAALEKVMNAEGATGSLNMLDHRCTRPLTLYEVKKGAFEVVRDSL